MKVVLLGTAPHSFPLAPFANPDWSVWACSPGTIGAPRIDVFFELHRFEPGQPWFSEAYINHLKNFKGPIWMAEETPDIPNCNVLPVVELVEKYGPYFFTSSLAWMMAMAIEAGAEKIALYGVDMAATEEVYSQQRAGCHYFAMIARALGIEVGVPPESDLLRPPPLYGVCETSHAWIKTLARRRELEHRIQEANNERTKTEGLINFLNGALDDLKWNQTSWVGNTDTMGKKYIEPPHVPVLKNLYDTSGRDTSESPISPPGEASATRKRGRRSHKGNGVDTKPRAAD